MSVETKQAEMNPEVRHAFVRFFRKTSDSLISQALREAHTDYGPLQFYQDDEWQTVQDIFEGEINYDKLQSNVPEWKISALTTFSTLVASPVIWRLFLENLQYHDPESYQIIGDDFGVEDLSPLKNRISLGVLRGLGKSTHAVILAAAAGNHLLESGINPRVHGSALYRPGVVVAERYHTPASDFTEFTARLHELFPEKIVKGDTSAMTAIFDTKAFITNRLERTIQPTGMKRWIDQWKRKAPEVVPAKTLTCPAVSFTQRIYEQLGIIYRQPELLEKVETKIVA